MFEGFVDETPGDVPVAAPGPALAEQLLAEDVLASAPEPADHSVSGEAAWEAATSAAIGRLDGWARTTAWVQAQEMLAVEALVTRTVERAEQRPPGTPLDEHLGGVGAAVDSVVAELALTWQVAGRTASRRVDEAVSLVNGIPLAVEAMLDGRLGLAHVRALGAVLLDLDPALAERICRQLLDATPAGAPIARTPAQLAGAARRTAIRLDPGSARRRERAAARERGVHLGAEDHGMATVTAYLPAAEALLLYRTIDAHARRVAPDDPAAAGPEAPDAGVGDEAETSDRSPAARRADALCDLVGLGALAAAGATPVPDEGVGEAPPDAEPDAEPGEPPTESRDTQPAPPTPARARGPARAARDVQVRVLVSADTLLGLDEEPAELVGYGPITAAAARRLAADADATWRRVLTDPRSGAVLDVGHRRYRPPAAMADHVRHRDLTCTFPGCRVPAQACDLDHLVPYNPRDPSGRTAADNLAPDCRHHHRVKHLRGWSVRRDPDGSVLWTTPSGRRYRTVRPVLAPMEITESPPGTSHDDPCVTTTPTPADDLRVVLEHRLRRPVTTAASATTRGDDDAPY
ncbi:DUF222 domain-containing protein [Actinomycetospora sp. CA-101289]|uniref:HNH endonuclease signature motif containing protein n=1 Tax=Actinomycetospora sp. CA-101289 TaxID=3239893 RepID=UPI003D953930